MNNRLICLHWRENVDMQIILDESAAINYIFKYATKGEKAGQELTFLVLNSQSDDNPQKKLRSIMIKMSGGKRDLSQCEVSRLLLSQPLYRSSFDYITLNNDLN
jgi:hypothetical protein